MAKVHLYYEVAMLRGARVEQDRRRNERSDMMNLDRADPVMHGIFRGRGDLASERVVFALIDRQGLHQVATRADLGTKGPIRWTTRGGA